MSVDPERLLRLLLSHRAMLLGYIIARVRQIDLAEDIFQDVAVVILSKGARLNEEAGFAPWARKIARLEALARLRKRRKSPRSLDQAVLEQLEDHWRSQEGGTLAPTLEAVRACTQKLSPGARQLIELRFVHNVRGKDLAAKLGKPANTVYVAFSRIYRALSACIRKRLASDGVIHG